MERKPKNNTCTAGIDVSMYQCHIDWPIVAQSKKFVFIKATDGATFVDPYFAFNWSSAKKVGMIRGAYHFFGPNNRLPSKYPTF